jgi:hypothetical protein
MSGSLGKSSPLDNTQFRLAAGPLLIYHFTMDETDFEGTLVLEQLATIGKVEDFFDAVDSDDVETAITLMKKAKVDASTMANIKRETF